LTIQLTQWTQISRPRAPVWAAAWDPDARREWDADGEWVPAVGPAWVAVQVADVVAAAAEEGGDIMPWVDKNGCTGCGICVETCPVDTIEIEDLVAVIHMTNCIRCGLCHDACPAGAIRHDSELIPEEVAANVARAREIMVACQQHLGDGEERKCLQRMIRHFNKERKVIDATLEKLKELAD